jgi:transcriptional regulator with XRE-family HTH domain
LSILLGEAEVAMRRIDSADIVVGQNLCIQRIERGLSQAEIGEKIGVSFQQIQKYEKGVNRISAGRLWRLASAFQVPVEIFYAGLDKAERRQAKSPLHLIANRDSLTLVRSFSRIRSRAVRRSVAHLVKRLGDKI